jgi:hypothetical protein
LHSAIVGQALRLPTKTSASDALALQHLSPWQSKEFQKYVDLSVDESVSTDIFHVPPEAGLRLYGAGSSQILGLQIGTQFCPGNDNPA